MKSIKISMRYCAFFVLAFLFSGCSSTTLIQSNPSGAIVYINGEKKGTTPYSYTDTKIIGSSTPITLKKDEHKDFNVILSRNEQVDAGAIIGGFFVWIPFLWTMKYDPSHTYELEKIENNNNTNLSNTTIPQSNPTTSNANVSTNELIKLKGLLDQNAISNDDFTTLKVKILNNNYDYSNSIADQITKLKTLYDSTLLTKEEYESQKKKLIDLK